jgi:hypothetical protein
MVLSDDVTLTPWIESGAFFNFWCQNGVVGDAGVPAVNNTSSIGSRLRKLHFCDQDYHKLLEFFFFVSVPPSRSSSLARRRNQLRRHLSIIHAFIACLGKGPLGTVLLVVS